MRLLTKNEVQQELAVERKMSIDEGISLARKVDGLRQSAASEEANLESFRTGTVSEVLKELEAILEKRDLLRTEVEELEATITAGLDPLYTKQAQVDMQAEAVATHEADLTDREQKLAVAENARLTRLGELDLEEGRIADEKQRTQDTLFAANTLFADARDLEQRINDHVEAQTTMLHKREVEVARREVNAAARERDLDNRTANMEAREQAVNEREKQVEDLYLTYQRNVERNG